VVEILKGLKEQTLDRLSVVGGKELDLTANLSSLDQMEVILECHAHAYLGSEYVKDKCELLERLTASYQGRHRQDLVDVGKSGMNPAMGFNGME